MKSNKIITAALAGLLATNVAVATNSYAAEKNKSGCNSKDEAKMEKANCKTADGKERHACKGKNSCKGMGSDGKNSCKGKGSCATNTAK